MNEDDSKISYAQVAALTASAKAEGVREALDKVQRLYDRMENDMNMAAARKDWTSAARYEAQVQGVAVAIAAIMTINPNLSINSHQ